jgi:uncharacterized membrane protein YdjX (TVP38/TMEM64 family)
MDMTAHAVVSAGTDDRNRRAGQTPQRSISWDRLLNGLSLIVIVICLFVLARTLPVDRAVQALQNSVGRMGALGPVVFGTAYVVGGLLFVPGSALTLACGAVFGLLWGTVIVSVASTATAALAFLIARYVARARVQAVAQRSPRFGAIDRAIGEGGWKIVALLRLSPAVPFSLGNYLYGLTRIRFWPYVLASWACMLPGTFMYVYLGFLGAESFQAAAGSSSAVNTGRIVLLVAGLVATVVVTVYVTRLARRTLAEQSEFGAGAAQEADANEPQPASRRGGSGARRFALPVVATLVLIGTVLACAQRDALSGLFGPPQVTLREAYADKPGSTTFDHGPYDELLRKHVAEGGWVDYAGLKKDAETLDKYIKSIGAAPFDRLGRDDKLALLINAYNAFTLRLILDHYPVKSIKDIPADKRWKDRRWQVGAQTWSLDEIEHEQIRPKFREPRVHFALVCAAIGCPPLRVEAYTGARLEEQLADQARYVHAHKRWFRFDEQRGVVHLTPLYDWFGDDFKQVASSVLEFAATYSAPLKKALVAGREIHVEWLDYDWTLNNQENAR